MIEFKPKQGVHVMVDTDTMVMIIKKHSDKVEICGKQFYVVPEYILETQWYQDVYDKTTANEVRQDDD